MATREQWMARRMKELAKDLLLVCAIGGMPDTFWLTDSKVANACRALKWTPEKAREWARDQWENHDRRASFASSESGK